MDCREFNSMLWPHLDGLLPGEEADRMEGHADRCLTCARELALQKRLSSALREMCREERVAPPELSGLVMAKLRSERRSRLVWLPAAWRKTIAAAAAILLLAGGSAGVTAGLKLAGGGKMIATVPVQTTGEENGSPAGIDPLPDVGTSVEPGSTVSNNETDTGSAPQAANPGENISVKRAASTPVVLLSSGLKTTGTILKTSVNDLGEARAKAVALAAGHGAATQVFPEQYSGKSIVVIRIAAPADSAASLIEGLSAIGLPYFRTDETRDITSLYNETLVKYTDLQSRISSSQNAEERRQLEAQAASYKTQLDAWDAEAGKQIITLWLESN